ncbi:caffeine-induced death protein-like protein [Rhexocercosporidium sp. MPI-PUGE-AT-0058]|nr:caffeine-induced death protein-like protein [Rhexocercosporidium sp. MPI-PUGE-AT-0058]
MFPRNDNPAGQDVGNLEDRLRGLILSNSDPMLIPGGGRPPPPPGLQPPFMTPPMQQSNIHGQHNNFAHLPPQPPFESAPNTLAPGLPSPPGRKRPNQAQRRQMNSQLSIPIDPRPTPGVQAGRGNGFYGPPNAQYGNQNFANRPPQQGQRYNQHPQQQYSPHFQNHGPASPYSPRPNYQQHSPQSPMHHYQTGQAPQNQSRQGPNHFSPQHQPQQQNAYSRPPTQNRQLYQPGSHSGQGGRPFHQNPQELTTQSSHLEWLVERYVPSVGIDPQEEAEKEAFRAVVELACREAISEHEQTELGNENFDPSTVQLQCFGSMRSGFATKASDMDLALLTPKSVPAADSPESVIPRLLEKKLLRLGYGARLLTRTRVPIIKLCQKPTEKLLSDLLEERQKWESGFASDHEDEDDHHDAVISPAINVNVSQQEGGASSSPAAEHLERVNDSYDEKLAALKQKDQQSLGDYCNLAKRLLRRLGGRDITLNSPELSDRESKILNDVCKAFISGLSSESLSTRLQQYQSISPLFDSSLPFVQRSIHGVWTQIEGERLAMAWESRPLTEPDDKLEFEALNLVEAWRKLQDRTGSLMEPTIYNRQLFMASEKLKKINSIQLVVLEQIQHEDPVYYQARAQKIMDELTGQGQSFLGSSVTPIVVAHYISGVGNGRIRDILQATDHGISTLHQVGLHHRALQLALDFEHALEVGTYGLAERPHVEQYVTLLRSRKFNGTDTPPNEIEADLIAKIRTLPDPTLTSLNKPRDRYKDHLEFPKTDIGIQCDINFSAQLAIHNTQLLRCYSQSDPRVKPMILFVKYWAKVRGVNTPYRGTLSSYGYVLMVLHYLVNIAQPFVCQNLQSIHKELPPYLPPAEVEALTTCQGRDVRFWRNEGEIKSLADRKMLNHNHDSVGLLLRGFFEYYGQTGQMSTVNGRGFDWGREVLSLRTQGGILSKQEKGWVGAKTVIQTTKIAAPPTPSSANTPEVTDQPEVSPGVDAPKTPKLQAKTVEETKEIRHRYLFAIEDPFELDHNVARTVTHNGIVSIRDEFRRAWKIIKGIGKAWEGNDGQLLDAFSSAADEKSGLQALMNLIHGPAPSSTATHIPVPKAEVEKVETAA